MSEQEKYDLTVKAADLIYRMFDGKKTTHSDILEKAEDFGEALQKLIDQALAADAG